MKSTKPGYRSRRGASRHLQSLGAFIVLIVGMLLPIMMSEAGPENVSLVGPRTIVSTWKRNATEPGPRRTVGGVVHKTVLSSKLRLSILVGLEGSGHHYLIKAVGDMFEANEEISVRTSSCISLGPYLTLTSIESSPLAYTRTLERARTEMHDLALEEKSLPWRGYLARMCSETSYPDGNGAHKALHYVDLRVLAEMAETEGVDIRFIYLKRSAREILLADTVHRRFQEYIGLNPNTTSSNHRFSVYTLILLTDAAVMHSFLAEIDPAFIVCHDYGHAGEEEQVSRIANFVAPNTKIAEMFKTSLVKTWKERHSEEEEFPIEGAETIATRLQMKLDIFESSLCG